MRSVDIYLFVLISAPFVGSLLATFLPTHARNTAATLAGAIALVGTFCGVMLYPAVSGGAVVRSEIEWLPTLGLNVVLRLDGLSWLFVMLVVVIGALVVLYARYYMSPDDPVPRFFSFFLAFMGAMLGIVMSGNLLQIVFFWELTSLFSFLLIGYWHHNANARDGARMALTVTATGGFCLLAGVLLIGRIVGSYDLDQVLASGDLIRSHELYLPALILILLGALTKSAQFPFHFWLPQAMVAPTPVSAYLHSATMVKAGVFLLIRLWPVLAGTDAWYYIVGTSGLITLLFGAYSASFQQDLKGLLAYSTISHLGLITLLIGMGTPLAAVAAIFHIVNHATFKASLFMAAGIIDHETGTRDLRRLSGLYRFMPITATLAMVAAAAMAGVPLLNGFLSKEMFLAEVAANEVGSALDYALPYLATLASAFSVLYSLRFIHQVFFGPPPLDLPREPHEPPHWMRFPIELLVLVCLIVGIVPALTIGPFLNTAVHSVMGAAAPVYSLAVWHGFTLPLLMSMTALVGGAALYSRFRSYLETNTAGPPILRWFNGRRIFDAALTGLFWSARALERFFGTRRLQPQLRLIVGVAFFAALLPIVQIGFRVASPTLAGVNPAFALVWVIGAVCAIGAAYQAKYHRLAALILMSGAGLVSCITFIWLSAPDLGVTQLLVEIVTTVLLMLGLRWLPKRLEDIDVPDQGPGLRSVRAWLRRFSDFFVAVIVGGGVALVAYAVMTRAAPDSISHYFIERALTEGGGANVVNVLLVDFRGFDTLGEITVLGIVGLTVFALLRRFRPAADSVSAPAQQRAQNAYDDARADRKVGDTVADYLLIPRVIMQWLFPAICVFAAYLFMRGHNLPGGGFAAGVTMAIAFILQYMAGGTRWVESRLRVQPLRWIGLGLLIALLTGVGSWFFGYPFLSSHSEYVTLPVFGALPLASAILFDLGVFALVVGATLLMLIAIAHQSIRTPRAPAPDPVPDPAPDQGAG